MSFVALIDLAREVGVTAGVVKRAADKLGIPVVDGKRKIGHSILNLVSSVGAKQIKRSLTQVPQLEKGDTPYKKLAEDLVCAPKTVLDILRDHKRKPVLRRTKSGQVTVAVVKGDADLVRNKRPKLVVIE